MDERIVMTLLGTRPEAIKLAPVIHALDARAPGVRHVVVLSGQHRDLVTRLVPMLRIFVAHDLELMRPDQTPLELCERALAALGPLLRRVQPELLLVQGDTTTALAGALAAFHQGVSVAHVEAGLRTDDPCNPFPEEMNRRLITRLARLHFAATERNQATLLAEGVPEADVLVSGNPVVDALHWVLENVAPGEAARQVVETPRAERLVLLTTHRRESFGSLMTRQLRDVRAFIERHSDLELVFPVHPNPQVREPAKKVLGDHARIRLVPPLDYPDFVHLLSRAWLVLSDSGGIQEEAPSLGKPLIVLRANTERPEVLETGLARLVGPDPERLALLLEEAYDGDWIESAARVANPFGDGHSAERIAARVDAFLEQRALSPS